MADNSLSTISKNLNKPQAAQQARTVQAEALKQRLDSCKAGDKKDPMTDRKYSEIYEEICEDVLSLCLSNDIENLKITPQQRVAKLPSQSYRRLDLECWNNPTDNSSLWSELKNSPLMHSSVLIFECKNLSKPLDDYHIFQLFMYLGPHRTKFGIILSRSGEKAGLANEALIKFYQLGYVILVFNDSDIKEMLDNYVAGVSQDIFMRKKLGEENTFTIRWGSPLRDVLGFMP